ncbi:MAG: hypothetical protein HKM95_10010, partial [Inquilinus sp.]|nr:hypothetical protein [Inquilinus sp.]
MSTPLLPIVCFGAAHIDRHARAVGPVLPATSNPVTVSVSAGGVARNVAETLARLGAPVTLVSRVGADADGDRIVATLDRLDVNTAAIGCDDGRPTASYTALTEPDGELWVGIADMGLYEALTPAVLAPIVDALPRPALWFVDCNLPAESLAFLLRARPTDVQAAVDAVSIPKAARLAGLLPHIDLLFCNADEAAVLAGGCSSVTATAAALRTLGAGVAVVGLGGNGLALADAEGQIEMPALPARPRDVTGAGDALIAGTLFGIAGGRSPRGSVALGLAAAALAI